VRFLATLSLALVGATPATIWGAVTGFYGTKRWTAIDVCQASYMSDRFALVHARIAGRRHIAALHFFNARRGWIVMWADGKINRKIGPASQPDGLRLSP